ncbi:MAG TPA: hypothetical protein VFF65_03980 [Phycisphaerales bacterium]|nr:hypothetical protein [Phycisphaerales bacterium]
MSSAQIAEFNATVAEVQLTALQVLKRLLLSESEPRALRQLAAIAFRARQILDPAAPRYPGRARTPAATRPGTPEPILGTDSLPRSTAHRDPAIDDRHPYPEALTPRAGPLAATHRGTRTPPLHLMQAAASASPLHALTPV